MVARCGKRSARMTARARSTNSAAAIGSGVGLVIGHLFRNRNRPRARTRGTEYCVPGTEYRVPLARARGWSDEVRSARGAGLLAQVLQRQVELTVLELRL